jgi:hypothetical protein
MTMITKRYELDDYSRDDRESGKQLATLDRLIEKYRRRQKGGGDDDEKVDLRNEHV